MRINAAVYTSKYDGIQQTVVIAGPGGSPISVIANTGRARINGGELEVTAKPTPELLLRGTYALTDAKLTRGRIASNPTNVLQGNAKHQATGSIVYTEPTEFGNVQGAVNYTYQSRVDFQPSNHLAGGETMAVGPELSQQAGYGLLDGRISVHFDKGDFDLALWGRNLTQKYYKVGALDLAGAGLGVVLAFYGEPRTFGLEFSKRF